jgi:hypothetical protein
MPGIGPQGINRNRQPDRLAMNLRVHGIFEPVLQYHSGSGSIGTRANLAKQVHESKKTAINEMSGEITGCWSR